MLTCGKMGEAGIREKPVRPGIQRQLPISSVSPPQTIAAQSREDAGPESAFGWFARGWRASWSVPGFVLFATFAGFGGLIHSAGFPLLAGLASTFLIWALPAQVILIGGLMAGTALPAIALAVTLSSIRLLPMVVSIAPFMRGRRRHLLSEFACSHYVAMTVWVEGLRLLPHLPADGRVPFTLGLGNGLVFNSLVGTVVGYTLAGELPVPLAIGLLALTPLSFAILMVRGAADRTDWMALAAGFFLTPFFLNLQGGLDLMIAGVGGGTLAYGIGRFGRRLRA